MTTTPESEYNQRQAEPRQPMTADEVDKQWRQWGVVEVAIRNDDVAEYMAHWEHRAERAEAELAAAKELLREARSNLELHIQLTEINRYENLCDRIEAFLHEKL